ncbi:MAG: type II secretion system F family protein, partial [Limisphaerales bacterium]
MPQFSYKARKRSGEIVQGVLDVSDRSAAIAQLQKMGLLPVAIDAPKGYVSTAQKPSDKKRSFAIVLPPALREFFTKQRKPKLQDLATFTQQLANLLQSGMPLTVALNSMTHLETRGISSDISKQLKQDVMEGKSLSDAMAKHPIIFSDMYVNMVRAGE